jgi:hypothetical protein
MLALWAGGSVELKGRLNNHNDCMVAQVIPTVGGVGSHPLLPTYPRDI